MSDTALDIKAVTPLHPPGLILIVDDDQDILDSLRDLIEMETEFQVETAISFKQAMKNLTHVNPDIALIDINLGGDDGLELIPVIKHRDPDIDCVMMTAFREVKLAVKALQYGATDYLFKPVDSAKLIKKLKKLIHLRRIKKEKDDIDRHIKTILDQSLGLIFLLSPRGLCLVASSAALSYIDQKQDRILGKPIWATPWLQHSTVGQKEFQDAINKVARGQLIKIEVEISDFNGQKSWFEFTLKAVCEKGEEVSLILAEGHDLAERKKVEQELKRMALYDPLTSLANRTLLYEHIGNTLAHATRHDQQFSVIFIDLDDFKKINDTFGHEVGDNLLVNIADCLKGCMRDEDIIARVGGDEFIVVLNSVSDKEGTQIVIDRLMASVIELSEREGYGKIISASVGISVFPTDGIDADTLLRNADTAMYTAKKRGKNRFQYYSSR